ncbi:sigma-70 family RNA polymerase sigma factor [Pollutimonas harenae]|uniref:Sigma-70 family RNA polymerase sigma factor n=1 Tax=Pollutimonas harenae TaxID=657015 RepID=A0A853H0M7_9BURK|nr:sigma-70 family RNA polymerase sigma factor [Pollutimonas harenae]NYT85279.1 sigma-70 family RNA polymerase sigma factor [Pollutimonas harenae]TEA72356.1 sigma-70 family RNA polymerase sigma factor [Pollutimonas harenae]
MKHESLSQVADHQSQQTEGGNEHTFIRLGRRLQRIAYRMLGSVAEAEDIVQETWLRWNAAAGQEIENEEAWLVSVTTRLSVDRLRVIKTQREHHSELWLSELQMTESPATPQEINERADDVSMAYLILLEQLAPEARAAFLMHEIFEIDYDQIAQILHKTREACRQLVSRAKVQLRGERSHFFVPQEIHHRLLKIFVQALERADLAEISALLAEELVLMGNSDQQSTCFLKQDEQSPAYVLSHMMSDPPHDNLFLSAREGLKPFRQRRRSRSIVYDTPSTHLTTPDEF